MAPNIGLVECFLEALAQPVCQEYLLGPIFGAVLQVIDVALVEESALFVVLLVLALAS